VTTRLVLTADTHLKRYGDPRSARPDLPAELWAAIDGADVVVHAGDWMDPALLDALTARASRVVGCWGNNDGNALRARLPEVARVTLEDVRFAVVHETGDAARRDRRCDAWFGPASDDPADVVVFGHSHIPWDSTTVGGVRLLNPGSPTERRRQPACTFMTAVVSGGRLDDVRRHDL
jgi:uncharacterized protein